MSGVSSSVLLAAGVIGAVGLMLAFAGDDLTRLWWRANYSPSQVEVLEKLHRLRTAAGIVRTELTVLEKSLKLGSEPPEALRTKGLALGDDVDYALKALDLITHKQLPANIKQQKKELARTLSQLGDHVDALVQLAAASCK